MNKDQLRKARQQYLSQYHTCKTKKDRLGNKVDMKLTFEEWLTIWLESGKYEQRGRQLDQYCMCRKDDIGHYEIGNVFIELSSVNSSIAPPSIMSDEKRKEASARFKGIPRTEEVKEKMRNTKLLNPYKPTEETKAKISKAVSGEKNGFYGKKHTEETLAKIRESRSGFKFSEESKKRMSESHKGQVAWNKGIPTSEETKAKIRKTRQLKPFKHSEETKAKLSAIHKGRVVSEETRAKIGAASKGRKSPPRTQEYKDSRKKDIHTPAGIFKGNKDAASFYQVCNRTIAHWLVKKPTEFYHI